MLTKEELEQINRFSKAELTADQVYTFSVRLCDNEVDRDFERFGTEDLERLGELFLGKSGIFDHQWSAKGQMARIYRTEVVREPGTVTAAGDEYRWLKGWASLMRTEKNQELITEIEGGNDSGIELMYVFNEKNELTGIVANLACPAQCVQHRLFVSPDFWGEAKMLLRQHFGEHIFLLPQCSAAGDQCPVDLVRWVEPESDVHDPNLKRTNPHKRKADPSMFDLCGMRKAGKRIANEIIEVYNEGLDAPQTDPEFVHEVHMMQLPLRRTTFAEVAAARRRIHDYLAEKPGDVDFNDAAALQVDLGILRREELQEKMDILDTECHIIRLGTIAIASNPFELFLDYGNQIKARSYAEQTFLIQLANGTEGYLPTEKAEKGGHYSAFLASGLVGHAGGEQLVRETLKNINKLFAE